MPDLKSIPETPYYYDAAAEARLTDIQAKVFELRKSGRLTPTVLKRLQAYFRIKDIYNSNAIEGNQLNYQETRLVVEQGLTISGKPLKDTLEAKSLSHALDLFQSLADAKAGPIRETDIRSLHAAVLKGVNDREAGKYREVEVAITGSPHKPPRPEAVAPEMQKLSVWLQANTASASPLNPVIVATVVHTWFVYIHPFADGNGRVGRLLLNLLLMRHGFPIAVITREERLRYYEALKESDQGDLSALVALVAESVEESLEEYLKAVEQQRSEQEWARSLVSRFTETERVRAQNEHSIFISAMELLKNQFRQIADLLGTEAQGLAQFRIQDYGSLDFEKFLTLRDGQAAKMTWFFGIQVRSGVRKIRYLFWFGFASERMRPQLGPKAVTLHVSVADSDSKYERIDLCSLPSLPELCEVGYAPGNEQFVWRIRSGRVASGKIDTIARLFFEQIATRQF
ncbi:MAG TPA: Fic family protein, partial [Candidatus Limnocylindria bacterium]|nr:Fic family protein [Candidatus Limnocylindria bacterium]